MSFDWSSIIHEISIKTNDSYWYTVSGKNISWSVIPQVNFAISKASNSFCEAQARVRQGSARDGSQGKRPQSLNPSLELTLKLVATHPPTGSLIILIME